MFLRVEVGFFAGNVAMENVFVHAAVDGDGVTLHVIGRGGGQKNNSAFQIFNCAPTTGGDAREDFRVALRISAQGGGVVGVHVPGGNGVDVDVMRGEFVGHDAR